METYVDLVLHYGGRWRNEGEMVYEKSQVKTVRLVDVDYISFFTLLDFFLDLRCEIGGRMWFKINGLSTNDGMDEIFSDADTSNMIYYNNGQDNIDVFMVEHDPPVTILLIVVVEHEGHQSMVLIDESEAMDGQQNLTNAMEGGKTEILEKE
ncbi:hypothetical protein IHE45_02G054200 [Dioscorea alata]|uniref:Uncharacterized protein n=1 Tax=Dioscorea alata TaxID=55571 RepID=A0ACB7WQB0_DIOAL|nr:hypothetical protein IHE45_02G054200 [Dioscorea alata]